MHKQLNPPHQSKAIDYKAYEVAQEAEIDRLLLQFQAKAKVINEREGITSMVDNFLAWRKIDGLDGR